MEKLDEHGDWLKADDAEFLQLRDGKGEVPARIEAVKNRGMRPDALLSTFAFPKGGDGHIDLLFDFPGLTKRRRLYREYQRKARWATYSKWIFSICAALMCVALFLSTPFVSAGMATASTIYFTNALRRLADAERDYLLGLGDVVRDADDEKKAPVATVEADDNDDDDDFPDIVVDND
ncbi:hypothetical protein PHYSODRAFT_306763 [Phytophthora sojae]|uniref:Transmembrane protein n=1 Tax=Phytophthora sojae (strain P6497) TaxID=1094619 RepID=G5AAR5_PHYSP|nr:hypothetical protein PHYSODRAFT_306763 [Phytophthora sojae]EGZ07694.1 hypothetical protein PHYSODRAFT_306763 [Phytophthora sojae]|eukprot:XP_009537260.1 hypothetical protein PHYSODRAFT_306763 [Phytophthora sojae]